MSKHSLNQIYFYLTEGCNLACRHCWLAPKLDTNGLRYPSLDVALFEDILRQGKELGLSGVKLTGGEPLLHPHIDRLLEIVHQQGLALAMETNGVLCTPEMAQRIAACENGKKPFVSVSLDGADAATHEWVRGVPGSFEAALQGVRNLAAAGLRPQVILSVMRRNAGQIEDAVRLAESLGARSFKFNLVQPIERGEKLHEQEETLSIGELVELGKWVETDLARRTPLSLHYSHPAAFQSIKRIMEGRIGVCGILGILGVLASGQYALCGIGENVPELVFGDARQTPLAQVWEENPVLQSIHSGIAEQLKGVCERCLMKQRCLGSCVAQNYYRSQELFAPFWFCELAEEAGLFPASRLLAPAPERA
jgi:SynChlorMet cassette radical SAM/SPASM protein ScmF